MIVFVILDANGLEIADVKAVAARWAALAKFFGVPPTTLFGVPPPILCGLVPEAALIRRRRPRGPTAADYRRYREALGRLAATGRYPPPAGGPWKAALGRRYRRRR